MNYTEAIAYLNQFLNFERIPESNFKTTLDDLDRFRELLKLLGNPQNRYPIIHIAGTKGKGSTAAMIVSVLRAAGYRVGMYTSPHLITVRERIQIDGKMISKPQFASLIKRITRIPENVRFGKRVAFRTVFEHLTAMTLLEFARRKVDVAVVEAGMGGKLDATVVVDPMVSVITPIGLDHTAVLGDTIEEIAADKAHIIKKDVPVISAPQPPEAHIILEQHAGSVDAPLTFCPGMDEFWDFNAWARYTDFDSRRSWMKMDNIRLPLTGSFQLINVSTALSVLEEIAKFGFRTGFDIVKMGLESVKWQGRMQIRYRRRFEIIDGAHNTMGVKVVSESVKKLFNKYKWRVIFATQKNKPAKEMIKVLKKTTVKFYLAPLQFPKSLTEEMLHSLIGETKMKADVFSNTPEALDRALQDTENNELVLVIGSLYLAGEIIRHRRKLPPPHSDGRIDDRI